ncbi:bifunctional methylenetetrahydrofolate dehydrogenase/methenyltetrahydrofolate cyclohydrolase FolD [Carnobacteriaceae bacterium zg-ZUI78]|nr:bifunctional methylenetetrahydrofolate dehydrogenase/methenyltetrahydrofolate cyclohydrolase FolD [Carnobacteriaceae bacterium zg-ZUI78]
MVAIKMDGKSLAEKMQMNLKERVAQFKEEKGVVPELVVLLVGENEASKLYVRNKEAAVNKVGMKSVIEHLPIDITEEALLEKIDFYNHKEECHGILVQLPLPTHLDEQKMLRAIDYHKDVDGFHPMNVGNFFLGNKTTLPCTPYGIMTLLKEYNIDFDGKLAVVVGRSNIVGKPMTQMLLNEHATVTTAHSRTPNLQELTKQADILVVAVGQPHFITKDFVKEGAIVVDVGTNRNDMGKLIGDVSEEVSEIASYITPVPGGVGPMTVTMLLEQTFDHAVENTKNNNRK